jgi:hypothetical protein
MAFGSWLRKNAEKYLMEAARDSVAARYPEYCAKPYREKGLVPFLWLNVFVPVYLAIPWRVRRKIILFTSYPGGRRPSWKKFG